MKKITLLSLITFLSYMTYGQDKVSLAIVVAPVFSQYEKTEQYISEEVKNITNWSVGLKLNNEITKSIGISTGLIYSTKGFHVDYKWVYIDPNDPFIPVESDITANYIDIPFMVNYQFLVRSKFSLYASTGLIISALIQKKEITDMADGSQKETNMMQGSLNELLLALEFHAGIKYNIGKKCFLTLNPFYQWGSSINSELSPKHPGSYGAMLGFGLIF